MLIGWANLDIADPKSLKHKLAEIVATVGWDLADKMVVCLSIRTAS